ncbi:IS1182 family transposase [Salinarimonas sp.]|uniref:IS1182 family transposase n=1 Tax=Salinarimonas sp. TaxID=2766526 RepID=UPI0032D9594D
MSTSKTFRPWDVEQSWLLPPSIHDFVPPGHAAHFVRETVREGLDLRDILSAYIELRGYPPYHPAMMVALLLYGYSRGVYSSRQLARACEERVDFMAVTGLQRPDFRTIADFRKRHLKALGRLFEQVLRLCRAAGLVQLGHVALDGTKIKANASRHKAMSYGRMKSAEPALADAVAGWLDRAETADREEDAAHGERRGDEMPDWAADKLRRLERIRAAKAALEAEAAAPAGGEDEDGPGPSSGMQDRGRPKRAPDGGPPDKAQRNFTDPDSRIQPTRDGFIQGYNAQIAVDAAHQVIVAHRLQSNPGDVDALVPLVDAVRRNLGAKPREISADAGFCSEANLGALKARRIRAYVAVGRAKHATGVPATERRLSKSPLTRAMAETLARAGRRSRYRLRKQVVEPVFGQIKQDRGMRQLLLRGLGAVRAEWALVCTAHNIAKLVAAHNRPRPAG